MQISDLVGQYSRNVLTERKNCMGRRAFRNWCRRSGISPREVFRGDDQQCAAERVTLALGNGQTITARLDGKMDLAGLEHVFPGARNDGQTIAIRPYTELGNVSNPILLNALSAAQVACDGPDACDGGYDDAGADVDRQTEHSRYGEAGWRESGCQCADHRADDEARTPGDGGDGGAV